MDLAEHGARRPGRAARRRVRPREAATTTSTRRRFLRELPRVRPRRRSRRILAADEPSIDHRRASAPRPRLGATSCWRSAFEREPVVAPRVVAVGGIIALGQEHDRGPARVRACRRRWSRPTARASRCSASSPTERVDDGLVAAGPTIPEFTERSTASSCGARRGARVGPPGGPRRVVSLGAMRARGTGPRRAPRGASSASSSAARTADVPRAPRRAARARGDLRRPPRDLRRVLRELRAGARAVGGRAPRDGHRAADRPHDARARGAARRGVVVRPRAAIHLTARRLAGGAQRSAASLVVEIRFGYSSSSLLASNRAALCDPSTPQMNRCLWSPGSVIACIYRRLAEAARAGVRTHVERFAFERANEALAALADDAIRGAAVLVVDPR